MPQRLESKENRSVMQTNKALIHQDDSSGYLTASMLKILTYY